MAFDDATRNRLANFVSSVRRILTDEFSDQLRNVYGLDPDTGTVAEIDSLPSMAEGERQTAAILRELLSHYLANEAKQTKNTSAQLIDRIVREQSFTVLNRLCALRMAEARDLVTESVANGYQSKGFRLYSQLAGAALGETGDAYLCYLQSVFDELAVDLPVLFDRFSEYGRLFPRESVLQEVLEEINHQDLQHLWAEDETIGWIYQYFNSKEERKAMRDASQAPRNSRELAVRNQFFTPRYVVEFLTDNTLGRIWYEMRKGETSLKDECQYLVRRPNEIFLIEGVDAPEKEEAEQDLTQKELLNQPVHIPHRPLKDPREIRMLDPACGSMHFGLYTFDLYLEIYDEYWDLVASDPSVKVEETDLPTITTIYESKDAFLRDVPRLIIEHNIHGIDIDPRAVQIAGLSLWLRAQRAWKSQGIAAEDRPQVTRSNIVCAEPMPGDQQQLAAFCQELHPAIAQMVTTIFEEMKLAGEVGSLLKIEQEIKTLVAAAKEQWQQQPKETQMQLFGSAEVVKEQQLEFDLSGITDQQFFEQAEETIYEALRKYASETSEGGFRRKLFAGDAEKGFAFVELCRKRFDIALMNPPFGDATKPSSSYVKKSYKNCKADILQAFVERCLALSTANGVVGTLSARTGFFLGESKKWREHVVFQNTLKLFADLGLGVLDDALVEVAAYVIECQPPASNVVLTNRQLDTKQKEDGLRTAINSTLQGEADGFHCFSQDLVSIIPDFTFGYWAPSSILRRYDDRYGFGAEVSKVRQGIASADDFRFARLAWEVPSSEVGMAQRWRRLSKGGEYSPVLDDVHLLIDWMKNGRQLAAFPRARFQNVDYMFRPGGSHPSRTASALAPRVLPSGCAFSHMSQSWFAETSEETLGSIGFLLCRTPQAYIEIGVGGGDVATAGSAARRYTSAVVEGVPSRAYSGLTQAGATLAEKLFRHQLLHVNRLETSAYFSRLNLLSGDSIQVAADSTKRAALDSAVVALTEFDKFDCAVTDAFALSSKEVDFVDKEVGCHPSRYVNSVDPDECTELFEFSDQELMARAVERHGPKRWITKKSYFVDRQLELICHLLGASPSDIVAAYKVSGHRCDATEFAKSVVSEGVGVMFGRWFVDHAVPQPIESPFDELPNRPVPMHPAGPKLQQSCVSIAAESQSGNAPDLFVALHGVFGNVWGDRSQEIESELNQLLGEDVRDYIAKPSGFFESHLSTYSRSRRSAPIYWPISTESGSYTLWFYYHRLTDQTLYKAVNDFVDPKLKQTLRQLADLRAIKERTSSQEKELAQLTELESDLTQFKADLLAIAAFWKPNLNDGVQITAAPLWKFFRLTKWRNKLKKNWEELESGKYDWAHLALSIWPDRVVREKCTSDRSIAIAHDMEDLFWVEDGQWRQLTEPEEELATQIERHCLEQLEGLVAGMEQLEKSHGEKLAADVIAELEQGVHDELSIARLLWPERVAKKCWDYPLLMEKHGLPKATSRAQSKKKALITKLVREGCGVVTETFVQAAKSSNDELSKFWLDACDGEYDNYEFSRWLWPERVLEKCRGQHDIALSHGLERFFWTTHPEQQTLGKPRSRHSVETEIVNEVARIKGL